MEVDREIDDINHEKIKSFVDVMCNSAWMLKADESLIDDIMSNAAAVQDSFLKEEKTELHLKMMATYPGIDFKKALDLLLENCIKNSNLNEHLTLYAIRKYVVLNPTNNLCVILENILMEMKLRENLSQLYEILSDSKVVDVDWHKVNSLLQEVNSSKGEVCDYKIVNALKTQTSILLNAVEYGLENNTQVLLNSMIECLESQGDLKLWFALMKTKNIRLVLDLCAKNKNFLDAVLKFFDRFADEIETNYDEDLNCHYSHLNLDFNEFVEVFKLFLAEKSLKMVIDEYLENKILLDDKNFLFWVDVKACL